MADISASTPASSRAGALPAGGMPVSAVVSDGVVRIDPDASLVKVSRALADADVGVLVVSREEDGRVLGVVSERDVVRAIASGSDPLYTTAADVATVEISWCDTAATVAEAAEEMMERYVRHILVEQEGRLVGVVSARDLLGLFAAPSPGEW